METFLPQVPKVLTNQDVTIWSKEIGKRQARRDSDGTSETVLEVSFKLWYLIERCCLGPP